MPFFRQNIDYVGVFRNSNRTKNDLEEAFSTFYKIFYKKGLQFLEKRMLKQERAKTPEDILNDAFISFYNKLSGETLITFDSENHINMYMSCRTMLYQYLIDGFDAKQIYQALIKKGRIPNANVGASTFKRCRTRLRKLLVHRPF